MSKRKEEIERRKTTTFGEKTRDGDMEEIREVGRRERVEREIVQWFRGFILVLGKALHDVLVPSPYSASKNS